MDKSGRITFKSNKAIVRYLRDLKLFYGCSTRSKLLQFLVPEAIMAVYQNPMPEGLSAEQKRAYKRIVKDVEKMYRALEKVTAKLEVAKKKKKSKRSSKKK